MAENPVALPAVGAGAKKGLGGQWRVAMLGASSGLYRFNLLGEAGEKLGGSKVTHTNQD